MSTLTTVPPQVDAAGDSPVSLGDAPAASHECIGCDEPTTSRVLGEIGHSKGRLCESCAYWCDGNIVGEVDS